MLRRLTKIATGIVWQSIVSKFQPSLGLIRIGAFTYGRPAILTFKRGDTVAIGKFCSIADDVVIVASEGHRYGRVSTFPLRSRLIGTREADWYSKGPVIIENDVWIGTKAIILSGVRIGNGAVIGAGALVTHDIPPYAIVAGVPAQIVKYRFSPQQIKQLLDIAWWDWSIGEITENIDCFYGDVDAFIRRFQESKSKAE